MVIVEGWVRLGAGEFERLLPALRTMIEASRAEAGCLSYAFGVDVLEPGLVRVSERWQDEAALAAHFATPHMAAFGAAISGAKIEGMSVKAYDGAYVRTLMGEE